jgi:hypothetical protein
MAYVFGNNAHWDATDKALGAFAEEAWTNFAKYG